MLHPHVLLLILKASTWLLTLKPKIRNFYRQKGEQEEDVFNIL